MTESTDAAVSDEPPPQHAVRVRARRQGLGLPGVVDDERAATLRSFEARACTAMLYPHTPAMAAWLNAWAADFAARTPDCLHTATFFPEPEAPRYVQQALEGGARFFTCHVQLGDFDPNDPLLDPVWGLPAESGVPVVVHCGSGPAPGRHTGPAPVARLLARHPWLRLVVAHMGMPEYGALLDLAERYEGSDVPDIPRASAHALLSPARLDLGDDARTRAGLHGNAVRLLGIAA